MPETVEPVTSAEIKSLIDRLPAMMQGKSKAFDKQVDTLHTKAIAFWKSLRKVEIEAEAIEMMDT